MTGIWIFAAVMLAPTWVVDGGTQTERTSQEAVTVDVNGPLVIGFFPPFTEAEQAADDGGIREGLAHLRFALEDIAKCYGNKAATYRLEITRSVILRDGRQVRRID